MAQLDTDLGRRGISKILFSLLSWGQERDGNCRNLEREEDIVLSQHHSAEACEPVLVVRNSCQDPSPLTSSEELMSTKSVKISKG